MDREIKDFYIFTLGLLPIGRLLEKHEGALTVGWWSNVQISVRHMTGELCPLLRQLRRQTERSLSRPLEPRARQMGVAAT